MLFCKSNNCFSDNQVLITDTNGRKAEDLQLLCQNLAINMQIEQGIIVFKPQDINQICNLLSDLCFDIWEKRWLKSIITKRYDLLTEKEQKFVYQKALDLADVDDFNWGLFAGLNRKAKLSSALLKHFKQQVFLDIDGFFAFRLKGYYEYLHTLISLALDQLLAIEEDDNYLLLLQGYLHKYAKNNHIQLYINQRGIYDICSLGSDGLRFLEGGKLAGSEDMLIFAILQLAPQKLSIFTVNPLPYPIYQTLNAVFGQNLTVSFIKTGQGAFYN